MTRIRIDDFWQKSFNISGIRTWEAEIKIENKLYYINSKNKEQNYPIYHYTENKRFHIKIKIINPADTKEIKVEKKFDIENFIDDREELFLLISLNRQLFESTLLYKKWVKKVITTINITLTSFFLIIIIYTMGIYSLSTLTILSIIWIIWLLIVQIGYIVSYEYFKMYKKIFKNGTEKLIGLNLINDFRKGDGEKELC